MDDTPNLDLPYILPAQAQKHVTHNEALRKLDAIVQLSVKDRDLSTPPGAPTEGERYIVAEDADAEWSGQSSSIAAYQDGAWAFYAPQEGWLAWVDDEDILIVWNGSAWMAAATGSGEGGETVTSTPMIGVNATADTTNRLALSSPATLLNHEGSGHQLKVNKAAETATASLLYQSNFSGRAEMGLAGNDDFSIKVSADGNDWHDSLVVDKTTGRVSFPQGYELPNRVAFTEEVDFASAIGGLWQRPAEQSLNAINWRHIVNQNPFDDGSGVGGENYANEVTAFGWNLSDTVGVPAVPGDAAVFDTFEYKYNLGGNYVVERHMEMVDSSGTRHRIVSWAAPHDGADGSSLSVNIDNIVWRDFAEAVTIQWQLSNNLAYLGTRDQDFAFFFENNGSKVAYQRDADDTRWIPLPYIDSEDKLILTGRQQNNIGALEAGQSGVLYAWNVDEVSNGAFLFNITAQSQTNSEYYAFFAEGDTNWRIKFGVRNVHPTGYAQADVISAGPAFYRATDYVHDWSFGKNAANDFFLGLGDPGTNTVFDVDKEQLNLSFKTPPKLPGYSITSLPSASDFGAGSLVFVQDASGGAVTAFSDGIDWRRTTDRSIVG